MLALNVDDPGSFHRAPYDSPNLLEEVIREFNERNKPKYCRVWPPSKSKQNKWSFGSQPEKENQGSGVHLVSSQLIGLSLVPFMVFSPPSLPGVTLEHRTRTRT